mmetsp:Transcript_46992/g.118382  ORF Transcript_46992/g.118382 Transcript_46992/m.118382 type:complete len:215 (+) Transcript_46992:524-1168(+)
MAAVPCSPRGTARQGGSSGRASGQTGREATATTIAAAARRPPDPVTTKTTGCGSWTTTRGTSKGPSSARHSGRRWVRVASTGETPLPSIRSLRSCGLRCVSSMARPARSTTRAACGRTTSSSSRIFIATRTTSRLTRSWRRSSGPCRQRQRRRRSTSATFRRARERSRRFVDTCLWQRSPASSASPSTALRARRSPSSTTSASSSAGPRRDRIA